MEEQKTKPKTAWSKLCRIGCTRRRIQTGDSVYSEKNCLYFCTFSTVSIYWEKVFLKILRDSVQMQCPLKTSLDFLICTQIIPWLLMETWEESVVLSTLFLFHPAFPPNSIPHLSSRKSVSGQQALFVSNMVPVATTIKFPGIGRFTFGDRLIWNLRTTVLNIF